MREEFAAPLAPLTTLRVGGPAHRLVTVHTTDGRVLHGRVDEPKGDPGNTLSRDEITAKALKLAAYSQAAAAAEAQVAIDRLWSIAQVASLGRLLEPAA